MQYPNVLIDEIMPLLQPSAVKVMNLVVRNTFGRQKLSDEMSLNTIQELTKLGREAVVKANASLVELGVVSIKRGSPGGDSNVYTLNVDRETGQLVRKSNQFEIRTSSVGGSKSELFQTHTKPRRVIPKGITSPERAPKIPDPRVKALILSFSEKFQAKVGRAYVMIWGKDGKLIKGLLTAGETPDAIEAAMDRYFANPFANRTGFDIGLFASSFNRLNLPQGEARSTDPRRVVPPKGKYSAYD